MCVRGTCAWLSRNIRFFSDPCGCPEPSSLSGNYRQVHHIGHSASFPPVESLCLGESARRNGIAPGGSGTGWMHWENRHLHEIGHSRFLLRVPGISTLRVSVLGDW
mmetsp:Transcript_4022/g.5874  ORF Transcript_4022/g.5874 Transcript_4022/m.5874 type:complete len:106 (+) Transcript_4022:117-434(+)